VIFLLCLLTATAGSIGPGESPPRSSCFIEAADRSRVSHDRRNVTVVIDVLLPRRGVAPPLTLCLEVDGKRQKPLVMVPEREGDVHEEWKGRAASGAVRLLISRPHALNWEYERRDELDDGIITFLVLPKPNARRH